MAYYNQKDFISETSEYFKENGINADAEDLCSRILDMNAANTEWSGFYSALKSLILSFMREKQSDYEFPELKKEENTVLDYREIRNYEEIITYLNMIKGSRTEENLKEMITESIFEENEKFNYFACLYNVLSENRKLKDYTTFLCCCSQLLVTGNISRLMLNWIIAKYSKHCSGGLDDSLGVLLNNNNIKYNEFRERSSFLRLAYSLRRTDPEDYEESEKRVRKMMLTAFGTEDYNPRSFIDMIYYYALFRIETMEELNQALATLASEIIQFVFDFEDRKKADDFVKKLDLDSLKSFLNFNRYSVEMCIPLFENKISPSEVYEMAEKKFRELGVNYFNSDVNMRDTYTYVFFSTQVEPQIRETENTEEFIKWMTGNRRYYEGYFRIVSHTRQSECCQAFCEGVTDEAAYNIVNLNSLSDIELSGIKRLNTRDWKNDILKCDAGLRTDAVRNLFDPILDALDSYSGDGMRIQKVRYYCQLDRDSLYSLIADELIRYKARNRDVTREDFLLERFEFCVSAGDTASEFMYDIDDDELMNSMRWEKFNPSRFHDAMLYMCLNTDDPAGTFRRINETKGYSYSAE